MAYIREVLSSMGDEWEDSTAISEDSRILGNLNWRSIEMVYVANLVQQHFEQTLPFEDFLRNIEQRETKDVTIGELVDFILANFQDGAAVSQRP